MDKFTVWRRRSFNVALWQEAARTIRGQLYLDRAPARAEAVLVSGSARSGTTWLAEIINSRNEYRYIYEPFRPGLLTTTTGLQDHRYLRPEVEDPALLSVAEAIFSGRIRGMLVDRYNRAPLPRRRLVKEIRTNLMLPWLNRHIPQVRPVLIVRHPCAVIRSQLRTSTGRVGMPKYLSEETLVHDYLQPFIGAMQGAKSALERHAFVWCVETYVPLAALGPGQVHVVLYEHLWLQPERELVRLSRFLGTDLGERALASIGRPSATSRTTSAIVEGGDPVRAWTESLAPEERKRVVEIVTLFGLDALYDESPLPQLAEGEEALSLAGGGALSL